MPRVVVVLIIFDLTALVVVAEAVPVGGDEVRLKWLVWVPRSVVLLLVEQALDLF